MHLLITVRLHDGRYHGVPEWPPSPARLFQALVAGIGLGGPLSEEHSASLTWLEEREPPIIGAPRSRVGRRVMFYMPNNDLDAVGGDPGRIAEIRTAKSLSPRMFDAPVPFLYAWRLPDDGESADQAHTLCAIAECLYQFGRGIDMAWASCEVLDDAETDDRLSSYPGSVYRPSGSEPRETLSCPGPGSLSSLKIRQTASGLRFKLEAQGKGGRQVLSQPPKPRFIQVAYDSTPSRRTYDLRQGSRESGFAAWPLAKASNLVVWLRDSAADKLRRALPDRSADIERALIGRKADGCDDGQSSARVRIVPLPSIGHQHADHAIRRVLVEVPAGCLLRPDDVHWAFSGREWVDPVTGAIEAILTPSSDAGMLRHFGVAQGAAARVWRTVTPAALPESAKRRRIDPARTNTEAKGGAERAAEETRAAAAVVQALRHADVRARPARIHLQREPFEAKGQRAEAFAPQTRFAKERLWHVEITFRESIPGPLVVGDGRFLGLGVMAPVQASQGVHAFIVESGLAATAEPTEVARAVRRAVMARVQEVVGRRERLPTFFSGHERDGSAARTGHQHLTFLFDPVTPRILVVAPHVLERRPPTGEEAGYLRDLDAALTDFRDLRAGSAGRLTLRDSTVDYDVDPLFAPSQTWEALTPYNVTRHAKHADAATALSADLCAECRRCGLPQPRVTPRELRGVPGIGLMGGARLTFGVAVKGPIVLGRSRHFGGGLFAGRP